MNAKGRSLIEIHSAVLLFGISGLFGKLLHVKYYSSSVIAFYEQTTATIVLIPFLFIHNSILQSRDILLLILLGTVFTAVSHTLFLSGLKNIKTQTAGIIASLEPVYGIVFAAFLLGETPAIREILGGSIILGTVLYSTIKSG